MTILLVDFGALVFAVAGLEWTRDRSIIGELFLLLFLCDTQQHASSASSG